ncbi:MAG: PHP domain-containing protein [Nanoarchaeota archaeon]|nr:PHP domain-containing protein [Nanoarchaeota archaeon]
MIAQSDMIKAQLHIHIKGDPVDAIPYGWRELVDHAKNLNYRALAITCHKRIVFHPKAKRYAARHGILLIKGVEIEIGKKHVVILNPTPEAEEIQSFENLKKYKSANPQSFIVAPHPFFPSPLALKNDAEKYIDLFDAIEHSYFYTRTVNHNKKAHRLAQKHNKPLIGTSDCHVLKYIDTAYSYIDTGQHSNTKLRPTEPLTEQILFNAIRNNRTKIHTKPLSHFKAAKILFTMLTQKLRKKINMV